jgi:hypothetical protein
LVSLKADCFQVGFLAFSGGIALGDSNTVSGIIFYLSTLYKKNELALRIGLFYTSGAVAGGFGGLLARGLSEIGPRGGLEGWRWIMIIEGLAVSRFLPGVRL